MHYRKGKMDMDTDLSVLSISSYSPSFNCFYDVLKVFF